MKQAIGVEQEPHPALAKCLNQAHDISRRAEGKSRERGAYGDGEGRRAGREAEESVGTGREPTRR